MECGSFNKKGIFWSVGVFLWRTVFARQIMILICINLVCINDALKSINLKKGIPCNFQEPREEYSS